MNGKSLPHICKGLATYEIAGIMKFCVRLKEGKSIDYFKSAPLYLEQS